MLSDSVTQLHDHLLPRVSAMDAAEEFLTLRLMAMEARHTETLIEFLKDQPHVPLDGNLLSHPETP